MASETPVFSIFRNNNDKRVRSPTNQSTPDAKKGRRTSNEDNISSNNFSSLHVDADMDAEMDLLKKNHGKQPRKVERPMPPITITQAFKQAKDTHSKIQAWVTNKIHFRIKSGNTEIITYNAEDHAAIQNKLREVNIEFITSAPPNTQNKKIVLKGIDKVYSTEEIEADLKSQGLKVVKVEQLISKKTGSSSERNPCAVWLSPDTNIAFVRNNIKYCCHYRVQWSNFMRPSVNRVIQCYNCREPGHKAQFCGKKFRCVKCISVHEPGLCPKKDEDKPRCVNCQLFHPANYQGCIILKEYGKNSHPSHRTNTNKTSHPKSSYRERHSAKDVQHKGKTTNVHGRIGTYSEVLSARSDSNTFLYRNSDRRQIQSRDLGNSNKLFSNVLTTGNSGSADKGQNNNVFSFLRSEIDELFGVSLPDFMKQLKEFVPVYKSETDDMTKKFLIVEFLSIFV